uniref:RING-type domain-containing protein n=1 Tax=Acrobeloides nanus TaxID=290746 RepID=A0A914EDT3_9BILA
MELESGICEVCLNTVVSVKSIVTCTGKNDEETDYELEFMDSYAHKFCNSCTRDYFNNTLAVQWPLHKSGNGLECMSLDCDRMISFQTLKTVVGSHAVTKFIKEYKERERPKISVKQEIEKIQIRLKLPKIRKCGYCGILYERIDGCNYMICKCKKTHCYQCGKLLKGYETRHKCSMGAKAHDLIKQDVEKLAQAHGLTQQQLRKHFPQLYITRKKKILNYILVLIYALVVLAIFLVFWSVV